MTALTSRESKTNGIPFHGSVHGHRSRPIGRDVRMTGPWFAVLSIVLLLLLLGQYVLSVAVPIPDRHARVAETRGDSDASTLQADTSWFVRSTAPGGMLDSCTSGLRRDASLTAGSSATTVAGVNGESICWYTPTNPGATPAGAWSFVLDVTETAHTALMVSCSGGLSCVTAEGDTVQWSSGGTANGCGASPNTWKCVQEETNDGDSGYVTSSSGTTGFKSLFATMDPALPTPLTVVDVKVTASCRRTVSQAVTVKIAVKDGTTVGLGSTAQNCANSATYTVWMDTFATKPSGGAWDQASLNALQIGCSDEDATTRVVRCSSLKAVVDYVTVYTVAIDKCTSSSCSTTTGLYASSNQATYGTDVTITTGTIGAQTSDSNTRFRWKLLVDAVGSGGTVTLNINGPTPGSSDTYVTVPIPENLEMLAVVAVAAFLLRFKGFPPKMGGKVGA